MANRLVIALDFGTTYSGVAYADAQHDQTDAEIQLFTEWPGKLGLDLDKAPSRICYEQPPDRGIRWGYEIKPNESGNIHSLMKLNLDSNLKRSKQLKLLLALLGTADESFGINDLRLDQEYEDPEDAPPGYPGRSHVDIIADYLTEVRKAVWQRLTRQYGVSLLGSLKKELVVTVPAVWSDRAKDLTLQAVKRADFKADLISLVPEPEAGAVYTLKCMTEGVYKEDISVGDMFVVCDAGGGTVDLISYRITEGAPLFKLEEAVVGSGDKCGAAYVEKEFVSWLEKHLGTAIFDKIPKKYLLAGSAFLQSFELMKYSFTGKEEDCEIRLPRECGITDEPRKNIEDRVLTISNEQMRSFFDPCVVRTLELIDEQVAAILEKYKKVPKMVILIGGFGRSEYLFREVDRYCKERDMNARKPLHPWSAVVRGAVYRGLERPKGGFISIRLARRHYGTYVHERFIRGVHLEEDAFNDRFTGEKRARGQMRWLLSKGEKLPEINAKIMTVNLQFRFGIHDDKTGSCRVVSSEFDKAPTRFADEGTSNVCVVDVDLNQVPVHLFTRKQHSPQYAEYYDANFQLQAKFYDNKMEWKALFAGQEYGTITVTYED